MTGEERYTALLKELGRVIAEQNKLIKLNKCIACGLEAELKTAENEILLLKNQRSKNGKRNHCS